MTIITTKKTYFIISNDEGYMSRSRMLPNKERRLAEELLAALLLADRQTRRKQESGYGSGTIIIWGCLTKQ